MGKTKHRKVNLWILIFMALILGSCNNQGLVRDDFLMNEEVDDEVKIGWGPERELFTMESPATYPVFNSIKNNPVIGDERDFVRIGEINPEVTKLCNRLVIRSGKQYLVYIYVHNNASSTFNDSQHKNSGIALKTRLSASFPNIITAGEYSSVFACITSENTNPESVWDSAYVSAEKGEIHLSYVDGSAIIYNDWETNGNVIPSSLFSQEGTLLGLNELNGVIPGCEEYHCVVSFVIEAK